MAGPSRGSDEHVEMAVPSPVGDVKIVSPISTFVLNTLTLKKKGFFYGNQRKHNFIQSTAKFADLTDILLHSSNTPNIHQNQHSLRGSGLN